MRRALPFAAAVLWLVGGLVSSTAVAAVRPLGQGGVLGLATDVLPSRDGSRILIATRVGFDPDTSDDAEGLSGPAALWAADADASNPTLLSRAGRDVQIGGFAISPDGARAVWLESPPLDVLNTVVVRATTDGSERTTMPQPSSGPFLYDGMARNGDLYAFDGFNDYSSDHTPEHPRLLRVRWGSNEVQTVASFNPRGALDTGTGVSPDHTKRCFYARKGSTDIWRVDYNTGAIKHARHSRALRPAGDGCTVADTGRTVLLAERRGTTVLVIVDARGIRTLAIKGAAKRLNDDQDPAVDLQTISPDGRWVFVMLGTASTGQPNRPALINLNTGRVQDVGGGSKPQDSLDPYNGGWSRDGRHVLFRSESTTSRWIVFDTRARRLIDIPVPQRLRADHSSASAQFSPNSKRLILTPDAHQDPSGDRIPSIGVAVDGRGPTVSLGLLSRFVVSADGSRAWAVQALPSAKRPPAPIPLFGLDPGDVGSVGFTVG